MCQQVWGRSALKPQKKTQGRIFQCQVSVKNDDYEDDDDDNVDEDDDDDDDKDDDDDDDDDDTW